MEDYGPEYKPYDRGVTLKTEINVGWDSAEMLQDVVNQVSAMIYKDIKPEVGKAVRDSLDDLANQALMDTFDTEVQPTDKWGKPQGAAIRVRALLQRDAETWLMDRVDNSGRMGRDSYGNVHPRIHWLFEEALKGKKDWRGKTELQKMVLAAVKSTIGDVEEIVNTIVRDKVKEALAK